MFNWQKKGKEKSWTYNDKGTKQNKYCLDANDDPKEPRTEQFVAVFGPNNGFGLGPIGC